jgi:general secretion pathway protein B
MSYILEALADSEQARQQLTAAPKYSLLSVVGEDLPPRRRWPYALAGALLVNAAVLQVWLHPVLPGGAASIKVATVPQLAETPALVPGPAIAPLARSEMPAGVAGIAPSEARPPQSQPERANDGRVTRSPAPVDAFPGTASANSAHDSALIHLPKLEPAAKAKRGAKAIAAIAANPNPSPALSATAAKPAPAGATPAGATPAGATTAGATPADATRADGTAELPPALLQEMPALAVAGFIRGEGSSSMVIVNDRLVREGDEVAPGVKLEKILNDGLVFNYKGYRFRR